MFDKKKANGIKEAQKKWEDTTVSKTIQKTPERRKEFFSASSIPVKRLYTPSDIEKIDYMRDLGFPGEFPATRGVQPTMYRGRFWTMCDTPGSDQPRRRINASSIS